MKPAPSSVPIAFSRFSMLFSRWGKPSEFSRPSAKSGQKWKIRHAGASHA